MSIDRNTRALSARVRVLLARGDEEAARECSGCGGPVAVVWVSRVARSVLLECCSCGHRWSEDDAA